MSTSINLVYCPLVSLQTKLELKNIAKLFSPKSIAVIGVSQDTAKIGTTILTNLLGSNYEGKLFPVNPKYKKVLGLKAYPSVAKIPHRVDMAIMAIPAPLILDVIKDCAKKKVKNLVVISAGFREASEKGAELEAEAYKLAQKKGISLIGPNCLGLISTDSKMNASFAASNAMSGDIAFMSQSGAVCTSILDQANAQNLGFSHFVSLGNKVDVNENHLLEYWLRSSKVNVIGAYLEEFVDGYDFTQLKAKVEQEKPIVVLHPGKSEASQAAISSHTGSVAGSSEVITAALKKNGIIEASDINQMTNLLKAFSWSKLPSAPETVILTNAGGPGIIATDLVSAAGLKLTELQPGTKSALKKVLPEAASVNNPVDILGDADAQRYLTALSALEQAQEVKSIILILTPQIVTQIEDTAKLIINLQTKLKTPLLPVFIGGEYVQAGLNRLSNNKIIGFSELPMAVETLAKLWEYQDYLNSKKGKTARIADYKKTRGKNIKIKTTAELQPLPEEKVQELLKQFEFSIPETAVIKSWEEAEKFVTDHKFPVVLKATTEDIVHKTDLKALYLNIDSTAELKSALTELQHNIYQHTKREHPPVLIQQQMSADEELFIGAKRDGDAQVYEEGGLGFGHLILFGKGGIYTEVYRDFAYDILPMNSADFKQLINSTRVSEIIHGARGGKILASGKLVEMLTKLEEMLVTYPEIKEIDFNPVMLTAKEAVVVDAKVFVEA